MPIYNITGIDPGLVDTGVVDLHFDTNNKRLYREIEVFRAGPVTLSSSEIPRLIKAWQVQHPPMSVSSRHCFIEGYRPRAHLGTDKRMAELVRDIQTKTKGKVLANTGIKSVVKKDLLIMLNCWQFGLPTHHDDLRSAARILVLGMLKDPVLNEVVATFVRDYLDGVQWEISTV
jgi:hypothetical protein